jgi:hypothetical protein
MLAALALTACDATPAEPPAASSSLALGVQQILHASHQAPSRPSLLAQR